MASKPRKVEGRCGKTPAAVVAALRACPNRKQCHPAPIGLAAVAHLEVALGGVTTRVPDTAPAMPGNGLQLAGPNQAPLADKPGREIKDIGQPPMKLD